MLFPHTFLPFPHPIYNPRSSTDDLFLEVKTPAVDVVEDFGAHSSLGLSYTQVPSIESFPDTKILL